MLDAMSCRLSLAALLLPLVLAAPASGQPRREIAITIDDLPFASVTGQDLARAQQGTRDLVAALSRHKVPAIGFVNEVKLEENGTVNPERVALLRQWLDAGLDLGNHTRTHPDLHRVPVRRFKADVLEGEKTTRALVRAAGREMKYFRHPFLHTGRTPEIRDELEGFLKQHGYRVAPITMDNYDYLYAAAYDRAGARGDAAAQTKIVAGYLEYMEQVVRYYEAQSEALLGRAMRHTLLLHANALNAAAFDRLAGMLVARGYTFISLDRALEDPAYARRDTYFGDAGITWLHRWAMTEGKRGAFFAGEPEVPAWIQQAAARPEGGR
jgi:peptidoglycan/xylan/chitin deacetylase (PgdA/CDA1 family)